MARAAFIPRPNKGSDPTSWKFELVPGVPPPGPTPTSAEEGRTPTTRKGSESRARTEARTSRWGRRRSEARIANLLRLGEHQNSTQAAEESNRPAPGVRHHVPPFVFSTVQKRNPWGRTIQSPVVISLAKTRLLPRTGWTPHTNATPPGPGGTNCPSWSETPSSSMFHHTMPSEYHDEKNWSSPMASVLWSVYAPSSRVDRLFGVEKVPKNEGFAGSLLS